MSARVRPRPEVPGRGRSTGGGDRPGAVHQSPEPDVTPQVPRTDTGERVPRRLVAPVLPDEWATMEIGPGIVELDVAICTMARRHPAAGYRKVTSRLRRRGYVVNRSASPGCPRPGVHPHPAKAPPEGRGPAVPHLPSERAVADRHDERVVWRGRLGLPDRGHRLLRPHHLGLDLHQPVPGADVSPAMAMAWSTAFPHGADSDEPVDVTLRHDKEPSSPRTTTAKLPTTSASH